MFLLSNSNAVDKVVTVSGTKYNVTYKYTDYDSDTSFFTSGNLTWGNKSLAQSIGADVGTGGKSGDGVNIPYGTANHQIQAMNIGGGGTPIKAVSVYLDNNGTNTDCPNACPMSNDDKWYAYTELARIAFKTRVTKTSRSKIMTILEQINTDGTNASLITALDGLSDTALEKVSRQIEGVAIKKMVGQSVKKNSSFKKAASGATSGSSTNSFTNNYASLNLFDINLNKDPQQFELYSFSGFDFKSLASIYKNKNLFSLKNKDTTFFVRTFADNLNQDKVNDDAGYEGSTAGLLIGNESYLTDKIQQGWTLGLSSSSTDFDEGFGKSDSKTFHAMIFQNQKFDDYILGINIGTFVSRANMKREITEGSVQSLKSRGHDFGFDITTDIKQSYFLKNDFIFTPSFSINASYIIQDDLDETGGDLALTLKNDDLLVVKPEIGLSLNKNFKKSEVKSENFSFSISGSYEEKLDGTTSKAKIKSTSSNFNIVDDNTDDTFVTVGLGYNSENIINNSIHNLGIYHTQNDDDNLNLSLLSYNYKKTF
ncbi:autotransporter outer membrane beta-barrel domain-containing protein [Candidatus Pelagibacter sp.]|nr:autotransporter outer membrane beta-barrel domain-containing protein [Candidatus Pelagibacter sp.]